MIGLLVKKSGGDGLRIPLYSATWFSEGPFENLEYTISCGTNTKSLSLLPHAVLTDRRVAYNNTMNTVPGSARIGRELFRSTE